MWINEESRIGARIADMVHGSLPMEYGACNKSLNRSGGWVARSEGSEERAE